MGLIKISLILIILCTAGSCDQSANGKPKTPLKVDGKNDARRDPIDITGKSVEEVLAAKYQKAQLNCKFWLQRGEALNLDAVPSVKLQIDLIKGISGSGDHSFKSSSEPQSVNVASRLSNLRNRATMSREGNNLFLLTNVLAVDTSFTLTIESDHTSEELKLTDKSSYVLTIVEGAADVTIASLSTQLADKDFVFKHMSCLLEAEVKEGFVAETITLN
jgi:hypothetical protein